MSREYRLPRRTTSVKTLEEVYEELVTFREAYNDLVEGLVKPLKVAPNKTFEGMFAFADGTNWNPGSGRGLYQYVSGAWVKL